MLLFNHIIIVETKTEKIRVIKTKREKKKKREIYKKKKSRRKKRK